MNKPMKNFALPFLLILASTTTAGTATAGKATSQFAVTLTVASKCTITTSSRLQGSHTAFDHGTRLADLPINVNAHCRHGGRLAVTTDAPPARGLAIVDVAGADADVPKNAQGRTGMIKTTAGRSGMSRRESAPIVVTVTF